MIFPLPYSSYINAHGEPALSQHSILALEATLEYLKWLTRSVTPGSDPEPGLINNPKIVLIAEQTYGSKTNKTADLMKQFLVERKIDIQNIQTIDRATNNTYEQLEALKPIVDKKIVTLIAFAFHVPRIGVIAHHLKLNVQILTVEELLKDKPDLANEIAKINSLPKMQKVLRTEKALTLLAKLDRLGPIPKTYSHMFGSRMPLALYI